MMSNEGYGFKAWSYLRMALVFLGGEGVLHGQPRTRPQLYLALDRYYLLDMISN